MVLLPGNRKLRGVGGDGQGGLGQAEGHHLTLPFSQGPQLVVVKVGVSPDPRARGEGMSQEPVLAVEGVAVAMLWNTRASASAYPVDLGGLSLPTSAPLHHLPSVPSP